ncbi:MAG: accessory factor UbiK family protein [Gammaproteobacteria bacterium]|jgi:BMFP domain-containing protein YqiC
MKNEFKFEEIAKQILGNLPSDFGKIQEDVEKNLKSSLQATFSRLDLVSREEFDIQSELLSRTRSLVEVLEKKIDTLEQDRKQ